MLWSREHRAFAVESFLSNGRSVVATQRAFRIRFEIPPHRLVPGRNSILSWINSIQECGNVAKPRKGRQRTIRSPENIERVRQSIERSPRRSASKHAAAMGISDTTVRRILHEDLKLHPYKLAVVQELTERDFVARQNACEMLINNLPEDAVVFFSDEAHFHISGCVNKQNMRYWCDVNPRELHQKPLNCERVTV